MAIFPSVNLTLPEWINARVNPDTTLASIEERMRFVISLAVENVEQGTGGPFAAAVFELSTGRLVAPAVNIVERGKCSLAHAEAMALMVAQQVVGSYDLGGPGLPPLELVTTSQPCIQCWGNVWWSGIKRLVTGTSIEQTQSIAGFDEGPVPPNWAQLLRDRTPAERSVEVIENVLSDEACAALKRYKEIGARLY
jgi:tRNA(Arg) A34 adenosine deaminase TadA